MVLPELKEKVKNVVQAESERGKYKSSQSH